jgi:hypothetical protein
MRGPPQPVDLALSSLARSVSAELAGSGWKERRLDGYGIATFTRDTRNGVMATAELHRTSSHWPDDWPVAIGIGVGVGYGPALDLMPLLTLQPAASLLASPETAAWPGFTISLPSLDEVPSVSREIVGFIDEHALAFADQFRDAAAIEAALQLGNRAGPTGEREQDGQHNERADYETALHLTLLAAMGQHDLARRLLARYARAERLEPISPDDRRFIRQLTRWLDAGGPTAPPIAETLARLPSAPRPPRLRWSEVKAQVTSKSAALDAVRAQSAGKSLTQLQELLAAEYDRRGLQIAPSVITVNAKALELERQPFGRTRSALRALRMVKSSAVDGIRLLKHDTADPPWLQPPDRASYPVPTTDRFTAVDVEPAAQAWLTRVWNEAPRRLGHLVLVDVWLSRDDRNETQRELVVHIGQRRVGSIGDTQTAPFDQALRAAATFDEDPYIQGRLSRSDDQASIILEIAQPNQITPES